MKTLLTMTLLTLFTLGMSAAAANETHSIESLERERASMVSAIVDDRFDPQTRSLQIKGYFRRLTDIERMVLRDERLLGNNNATVKRAFANYDLTFLVHASAEAKRDITDHWLEQAGLSAATVMSTKAGRR